MAKATSIKTPSPMTARIVASRGSARLLSAERRAIAGRLPGYFYSTSGDDQIFIHLFASGDAKIPLGDRVVKIEQATNYPWDSRISIKVNTAGKFGLNIRIPSWSNNVRLSINGQPVEGKVLPRAYHELDREMARATRCRSIWRWSRCSSNRIHMSPRTPAGLR